MLYRLTHSTFADEFSVALFNRLGTGRVAHVNQYDGFLGTAQKGHPDAALLPGLGRISALHHP